MPDPVEILPPLESAQHVVEPNIGALDKTLKIPTAAWVLYDTANTVYAAVLTYIFAPYLGDLFGSRTPQGVTNSLSMVAAGLMVPVFASAADRTGRSRLYLIVATLGCVGGLALFGFNDPRWIVLVFFFIANVGYNAALVFYNSLLASVADDKRQGLISGIGVGLGYIGTLIIVLLLGLPSSIGYPATFVVSAGIFLLLAMPCFLLVKERRVLSREKLTRKLVGEQFRSVWRTIRGLPKDRAVMWFFIGNFFCVDVLNTAILFFGDFTRSTFFVNRGSVQNPDWISRGDLNLFGVLIETPAELLKVAGVSLNVLALLFGVLLGFMSDKWGSLRTMRLAAFFLILGLIGAAVGGGVNVTVFVVGICGFGALGLAGIWTAGRKLLIELSPRAKLGEYFGLYGITMKLSVLGSTVFAVIYDSVTAWSGDDLTGWKAALLLQALPLAMGLGFLFLVKPPNRKPADTTSS